MPTAILEAASVGNYDAWTNYGGADKVVSVALPDDDDTTYILEGNHTNRQSYTLDPLSGAGSITSVAVMLRARGTNATSSQIKHFLRLGGTDADSASNTFGTSYAEYTWNTVGRPGGGDWTPADFTTLEVGCIKNADTSHTANRGRVTTIEVHVVYVPVSGGMLWNLG